MDQGFYGTCTGCQTTKEAYEEKFSIMRHQFLDVKAKARNTDEVFATLADRDRRCVEAEGKLNLSVATLQTYRDQLRSYLKERMGHEERCKAYEATIKQLTAACDRDACAASTLTQVNAQLELDLAEARGKEAKAAAEAKELENDLTFSMNRVTELHAKVKKRSEKAKSKRGDCADELMARCLELSLLQDELDAKTNELDKLKAKLAAPEAKTNESEVKTNEPKVKTKGVKGDAAARKIAELEASLSLRADELSSVGWEVEVLKKANEELESRLRREAAKGDVAPAKTETPTTCTRTESSAQKSRETSNEHRKVRIPSQKSAETSNEPRNEKMAELKTRLAERDAEVTKLTRDLERLRKSKAPKVVDGEKDHVFERRIADLETMLEMSEKELSSFKRDVKNKVPGTWTVDSGKAAGDLEKQLSLNTRPPESKDNGAGRSSGVSGKTIGHLERQLSLDTRPAESTTQDAGASSDDDRGKTIGELEQPSLDTRPASSKGEAKNVIVGTSRVDDSGETIGEQGKQLDTRPAAERLSTESTKDVQCRGCAGRATEVEALKRERSTLNKRLAVLTLSKESKIDAPCQGCAEREKELEALKGERSSQDKRLAALTRELEERGKEMKALKCAREADRNKSFEEKWRAAEARTFQLVAELAQLKAGAGAAHAARARCGELEREVARLKAEVDGLLSKQPKPVFLWDTDLSSVKTSNSCNSSGIGSCLSIDLEDESLTFPDDVATIPEHGARTKTTLLEPIDESSDDEDLVVFRNIPDTAAGKKIPEDRLPGIATSAVELEVASKVPEESKRAAVEKLGRRDHSSARVGEDDGRKGASNEEVFEILLRARTPVAPLSPIDGDNDLRSQFNSLDVLAGKLRPCGDEDNATTNRAASRDLNGCPVGRRGRKFAPYEARTRDPAVTSQERDLANLIESVKIVARSYSDFYGPGVRESRSIESVPESGRDGRSTIVNVRPATVNIRPATVNIRPASGIGTGERTQNDVGLPVGRVSNLDSADARSEEGNARASRDNVVRSSPRNHPRRAEFVEPVLSTYRHAALTKRNVSVQPSPVRRAAVLLSELPTLPEVVNVSRPTKMSFKDVGKAAKAVPSKARGEPAETEKEVECGSKKASRRARYVSVKSASDNSVKGVREDSKKSPGEDPVKRISDDSLSNASENRGEGRPATVPSSVVERTGGKGVELKTSGRRNSMSDLGACVQDEGRKSRRSSCSDLNLPSSCVEVDLVTDLPKESSLKVPVTDKSTSLNLTTRPNNITLSARLQNHSSKSGHSKVSEKSSVVSEPSSLMKSTDSVEMYFDAKLNDKTLLPETETSRVSVNSPSKCLGRLNNSPSNLRRSSRIGQHARAESASSVDGNASSNEDKTKKWEDVLKECSTKKKSKSEVTSVTSVPSVVGVSATSFVADIPRREPAQTRQTRNRKRKEAEINLDSWSTVKPFAVSRVRKSFELTKGQRDSKTSNAVARVVPHLSSSFVKGETIEAYGNFPSDSAEASPMSSAVTSIHDVPPTALVAAEKAELLVPKSPSQVSNEELVRNQKSGVKLSTQKELVQTELCSDLDLSSERNGTEEIDACKDAPKATGPEQTVLISDLDLSSEASSFEDTSVFAEGSTKSVNTDLDTNADAQIVPMEVTECTSSLAETDSEKASIDEVSAVKLSKDSESTTDSPGIRIVPATSEIARPDMDLATDDASIKSPTTVLFAMPKLSKDSGSTTDSPGIRIVPATSELARSDVDLATDDASIKSPTTVTCAMPKATEPQQTVLISDLDLSSEGSNFGDTSVFAEGSTKSVNTGRDNNEDAQIVSMEVAECTSNVLISQAGSTDSENKSIDKVSTVEISKDSGGTADIPGVPIETVASDVAQPEIKLATCDASIDSPTTVTSAMLLTDSTCRRIETSDADAEPTEIESLKRERSIETRPTAAKQLRRESVVHTLFGSSEDEASDSSPMRKPVASYPSDDDGSEREFAFSSSNEDREPLSPLASGNPSDDDSFGSPVARSRDYDSTRGKRQKLSPSVDDLYDIIGVSPTRDRKLPASSEVFVPSPILPADSVPAIKIVPKPHIPIGTIIGVDKIVPRIVSPLPVMPFKTFADIIVPSRQEVSKNILSARRDLHSNTLRAGPPVAETPLLAGKYNLRSIPPFVRKPSPTVNPLLPTVKSLPPTVNPLLPTVKSLPPTTNPLPPTIKSLPPTIKSLPPTEESLTPTDVTAGAKFDPSKVIRPVRPSRREVIRASVKPPSNSRARSNAAAKRSSIVENASGESEVVRNVGDEKSEAAVGNVVQKSAVLENVSAKSAVAGDVPSAWQTALRNLETVRWARENESSEDEDSEDGDGSGEEETPGKVAAVDPGSVGFRGDLGTASVVVGAVENVESVTNVDSWHPVTRGKNFYVGPSTSRAGATSAEGSATKRANFYGVSSSEMGGSVIAGARGVKRKADEIDGNGDELVLSRRDEKIASNEFEALEAAGKSTTEVGTSTSEAGTSSCEAGTSTCKAGTSTGKAGTSTASESGQATGEWSARGYLLQKAFEVYQTEAPRMAKHLAANPPKKSKVSKCAMKWAADEALGRLHLMDNSEADEPTGRQAFDAIVEQLAVVDNATLVKHLLHVISTDAGTVPPPPAAPPLTPTQRRVATLGALLDRSSRPGLLGELMEAIEQRVCHLGRVRQEESVTELMARCYAGLCAARDDMAALRCFLYDLLYCLNRSHRAVHAVLEVAPFALPHAFQAKDDLLAQTIVCTLVTKKGNEPLVNSPLARLLVERYKYNAENHTTALQIIAVCVDRLKKGGDLHSVEASLVLLAKGGGWHWADRHMAPQLRSVVDLWRGGGSVSDRAAEVALKVAAAVARTYPKDRVDLGVQAMWRLQEVVLGDKTSLHETAISCLLCLCSSHKNHRTEVAKLLLGWTPSAPPSPSLVERVVSFMANEPPTFWQNFFRRYAGAAGRRQAYVAFGGGRAAPP